ncbi:glycosyltransferase family 2 protein [Syntrophomonas palmitatica]|uniref:glycosyltransferase family 2 protein n=1 Tax=Syntrophomonas palmitatica TaxID=402877 RepID=UPI0006D1D93C|nr:glycosyltransferase family 2 protein [Syntrophomonas palmitatica]
MHISVVTPAYKCSECIEELYKRLIHTFNNMNINDYEIIFINDGSPDNDWEVIRHLCQKDSKVKGINLTRNFGQHKAIAAGLDFAQGEWVIVMDCDLQDTPEEISKLYYKALEGYDVVFGRRYERKDGVFKKAFSNIFNLVFNYLVEQKTDNAVANFSILNHKIVDKIKEMKESTRSHALFIYWLGYEVAYVDVNHSKRYSGKSSYNFRKSFNLALDFAISQSNKPLKIFVKTGFGISLIAFIYGINLIIKYLIFKVPVPGWTSIMVSLYFIAGLLLSSMGLLGIYIGKIFDEVKRRPIYAIKEQINLDS